MALAAAMLAGGGRRTAEGAHRRQSGPGPVGGGVRSGRRGIRCCAGDWPGENPVSRRFAVPHEADSWFVCVVCSGRRCDARRHGCPGPGRRGVPKA